MKHDDGDLAAAALFAASSNMFAFMLAALQMALKQERIAGFTADGRQVEPPIAHLVRPALESFLALHPTVGAGTEISPAQEEMANRMYREHLQDLRGQVLDAIHQYET